MPSDLQRVAQGLVECLDQVPQMVAHLQHTAGRCRENAALAGQLGATMAAHQLDAAAHSCEAAAHYLAMAPPKAHSWAMALTGARVDSTNKTSSGSADRNPLTARGSDSDERDQSNERRERERQDHRATEDVRRPPDGGESTPDSGDRNGQGGGDTPPKAPSGTPEPEPAPFIENIYRRLPERPNDEGPTTGWLTMPDGSKPIRLVSGINGPGAGAPGLTGRTALLDVARIHVEGHAAARMRRTGAAREMTLYLNNPPCLRHEVACFKWICRMEVR